MAATLDSKCSSAHRAWSVATSEIVAPCVGWYGIPSTARRPEPSFVALWSAKTIVCRRTATHRYLVHRDLVCASFCRALGHLVSETLKCTRCGRPCSTRRSCPIEAYYKLQKNNFKVYGRKLLQTAGAPRTIVFCVTFFLFFPEVDEYRLATGWHVPGIFHRRPCQ